VVGKKAEMEIMKVVFRHFRVATTTEAHSTPWIPTATGGLLRRPHLPTHGYGTCSLVMAVCTVTTTVRRTVLVSAA